jgi:hypothetical protein
MSKTNQTAGPSLSNDNCAAIFRVALNEYETVTGKPLRTHPFATQLETCDSPQAVASVLRVQVQASNKSRKIDERLMAYLDPTIHILFTFSATLGEGIGLVSRLIPPILYCHPPTSGSQPFSPAKTIFTGVAVLLAVSLYPKSLVASMPNIETRRQRGMFLRTVTNSCASSNAFTSSFNV